MEERGWEIFAPEEEEPDKDSEVFFNPAMKLNRDLSEIAAKVFRNEAEIDEFRVCDPMSASGIRGFRYSSIAEELHLSDVNPQAIESIEAGLEANGIEADVHEEDANVLLSRYRNFFHLIDIDPFGPFTKFLDSTARAANHSSFVGLTATDNGAASGSYATVCRRRYGSKPIRNSFMHETGLRIYIKEAFRNFARFDKCFEPKVCFQERHYSRVMGRVTESKSRTNQNLENIGYLTYCPECRWRKLERKQECGFCGSQDIDHAGPLWTGDLGDQRFTEKMLEETPEEWRDAREYTETLNREYDIRRPFYEIHEMSSELDVQAPRTDNVVQHLRDRGYMVSKTHFEPTGVRTDAPFKDVRKAIEEESTSHTD
ncbi:MAG: tRNA (guanine(10)-N(2))-dimethyltransferase [Candidatus Nanosalina sp.]